jgi:putative colanic acid biosynthesis acetyltransferase WcaF
MIDISSCRSARPYRKTEYIGRVLWGLIFPIFRFSPRSFFGWRIFLLRIFGAKIGREVHIYPSAKIYLPWNLTIGDKSSIGEWALIYNLGKVKIGSQSTVSHRAHLCAGTHDYHDPNLKLLRLPIEIGNQAWICADAFIGPNVTVGEGAIVGASAVVFKNVSAWNIVVGNPAKIIKQRNIINRL